MSEALTATATSTTRSNGPGQHPSQHLYYDATLFPSIVHRPAPLPPLDRSMSHSASSPSLLLNSRTPVHGTWAQDRLSSLTASTVQQQRSTMRRTSRPRTAVDFLSMPAPGYEYAQRPRRVTIEQQLEALKNSKPRRRKPTQKYVPAEIGRPSYHLPGYQGYVPSSSQEFGATYGSITKRILAGQPVGIKAADTIGPNEDVMQC